GTAAPGCVRTARSGCTSATSSRSGGLLCAPRLVGSRSVDRGDRHVQQPQIHGQLAAVMHEMVDVLANDDLPREREQHGVPHLQRPWYGHLIVLRLLDHRARLLYAIVEARQQLLRALIAVTC